MSADFYNHKLFENRLFDFADKEQALIVYSKYMLNRCLSMFDYDGLPDTIPKRMLELYLMTNGNAAIYKHEGKLYAFVVGLGGVPDEYYRPTVYTIANPYLNLSKNLKIDEECIVIRNDSLMMGLYPLVKKYCTALLENDLSMFITSINSRIASLISASDDRTKQAAEKYIKDIYAGKLGVIAEQAFLDGIRVQPYSTVSSNNIITNLIEYEQYLKASFYNEIGLNANYNMKRESINSNESQLNDDMLTPLIDDMLTCRKEGVEKVNAMFGTNISVKFGSAWEENEIETEQELGKTDEEQDNETERDNPGMEN